MSNKSVLDGFRRQCALNPSAPAVVGLRERLSYAELDARSSKVAAHLQARGVARGSLVPVVTEHSESLIVAFLAVMKAGAAYVPIDKAFPDRRKQAIASQCDEPLVLSTTSSTMTLPGWEVQSLDELLRQAPVKAFREVDIQGHDAAYAIFTSGTTGQPKGVVIEHHSLAKLVRWHNARFDMGPGSHTLLMASVAFDVSQWEVGSALAAGACIHVLTDDIRLDVGALLAFYAEHGITHAFLPTVMVPDFVGRSAHQKLALRYLFTGGEKLHPVETEGLSYTLVDYYGPTETTIFVTHRVVESRRLNRPASIGTPVAGAEVFILDERLEVVPWGEAGELCIAGDCLGRGYLGDAALTAERFVTPPSLGGRVYRTGDLARGLPDGSIQFLGRQDEQIKIRGNRVEMGEVESVLMRGPALKAAAVLVDDSAGPSNKRLVAFVSPRDTQVPTSTLIASLRAALRVELPDFMLPGQYLCLASLPTTANGKTDKQALREMLRTSTVRTQGEEAFSGELEKSLASAWTEVLGHSGFTADDSFFEVGGHSLLASTLAASVSRRLGLKTYIRDVYEHRTVRKLASALEPRAAHGGAMHDPEPLRALREDVWLLPGTDFSSGFDPGRLARPRHILLTGATGFVGVHLLSELLSRNDADVHCLVRDVSDALGRARLRQVVDHYQVPLSERDWERVRVHAGDIAAPRFGMSEEDYRQLSASVDVIYHSAGAVNFIEPYSQMKRDNVEGVRQVIAFAGHQRVKALMLFSTLSIHSWGNRLTGKKVMRETDDIDQNLPAVISDIGYASSKWVMEKIADLAQSQGLPLMTFRLGYATLHSRTGAFASYQWWGRLVSTCLILDAVPDLRGLHEGLTTVDYMTSAIAVIARDPKGLGKKFHVAPAPEHDLTLLEFFERVGKSLGRPLPVVPFKEWVSLWDTDPEAPIFPLLSIFRDPLSGGQAMVELYQDNYVWDCTHVRQHLAGSGIQEPTFTPELLGFYLDKVRGSPGMMSWRPKQRWKAAG
ncbi:amino acid adenylation domain-containing protein [Myxococcus sp. MISCRS1]|uniref:amino acid adenylation domain-containing protein n=1 Tax=Myxococcus sp. MISCRS1 TaxID=2996786 RepID=UPI002270AF17|nr:amino acid adenylation domain-containing protein [Myxococcus sp. MISCRS1]MCY0998088.1 amino acid adenylation domain-containing protein [Myxococcus sp. MISCRS1]